MTDHIDVSLDPSVYDEVKDFLAMMTPQDRTARLKKAMKEELLGSITRGLTLAEQYDLTHRPLIALHLARRWAATARMYAWSDRVTYTKPYNDELRQILTHDKPKGMEWQEWADFKQEADAYADSIESTITSRLHLACIVLVGTIQPGIDNIELRAWAQCARVALQSLAQLEKHYANLIQTKTKLKGRIETDERAKDLDRIMQAFVGADVSAPTLDSSRNEITNDILSINFLMQ